MEKKSLAFEIISFEFVAGNFVTRILVIGSQLLLLLFLIIKNNIVGDIHLQSFCYIA